RKQLQRLLQLRMGEKMASRNRGSRDCDSCLSEADTEIFLIVLHFHCFYLALPRWRAGNAYTHSRGAVPTRKPRCFHLHRAGKRVDLLPFYRPGKGVKPPVATCQFETD